MCTWLCRRPSSKGVHPTHTHTHFPTFLPLFSCRKHSHATQPPTERAKLYVHRSGQVYIHVHLRTESPVLLLNHLSCKIYRLIHTHTYTHSRRSTDRAVVTQTCKIYIAAGITPYTHTHIHTHTPHTHVYLTHTHTHTQWEVHG